VLILFEETPTVLTLSKHPDVGVEFDDSKQLTDHLAFAFPLPFLPPPQPPPPPHLLLLLLSALFTHQSGSPTDPSNPSD